MEEPLRQSPALHTGSDTFRSLRRKETNTTCARSDDEQKEKGEGRIIGGVLYCRRSSQFERSEGKGGAATVLEALYPRQWWRERVSKGHRQMGPSHWVHDSPPVAAGAPSPCPPRNPRPRPPPRPPRAPRSPRGNPPRPRPPRPPSLSEAPPLRYPP
jgi:hypothetical protein